MPVERWEMQSGRIATIDLTGHPDAVQGARELLAMNGATRIADREPVQAYAGDEYDEARAERARQRSAPAAVAPADRGEITNNTSKEQKMIETSIPDTEAVCESIRAWALQYAAKTEAAARIVVNDAEFQEWAAEQIRRRPEVTIDKCARRWVDENGVVKVPWPDAASPSGWNVDVGANLGGEVSVSIDCEIDDVDCPAVGAALGVLIAVVVDTDPSRTRPEPGVDVGDFFVSLPTISHWGVENTSDADADRLAALSRVMLRAAEVLPAVAEFSRLLGGSERSMEIPVGALAGEAQ